MKTRRVLRLISALMFGVILRASLVQAQQPDRPPLPPGFVYQVISETNPGDGPFLTAEELKLPPLPPGFVVAVVPEPTNAVDAVRELFEGFSNLSSTPDSSPEPGIKRSRSARLNRGWSASRSGKFVLNLFENATFTAVVERTEPVGSSLVRFCRLEGKPQSRLIVAEQGGVIAASLLLPGEDSYSIRYERNGLHTITELQPLAAKRAGEQCVVDLHETPKGDNLENGAMSMGVGAGPAGSEPPIVDIMIIYTPATTAAQGGPDGISTLIGLAVAEVNEVFVNSLRTPDIMEWEWHRQA